jgi:DNA invertase Pin-like site-specific DNA recombinase
MRPLGSGKIKPQDIERILELSEEGKSRGEIAKEIGCGKTAVYEYQRKYDPKYM